MSDEARTTRTETATHFVVTVVKPKTEQGGKAPSIRGIVKAGFENGRSFKAIVDEITMWHPTSAAAKSPKKHLGWYKSEMKGKWIMTGPWAPKASETEEGSEEGTETEDATAKEIAALEARLANLKAMATAKKPIIVPAPEVMDEVVETDAERMAREIDERLADKDEGEEFEVERVDAA